MGRHQCVEKQTNTGLAGRRLVACMAAYLLFTGGLPRISFADAPPPSPPTAQPATIAAQPRSDLTDLVGPHSGPYKNAPDAVRTANRRLLNGDPESALEAYGHAEQLRPDAREIAFGEGLAHYELGEYDEAREAFRKAAVAGDDLAVDSRYSLATCDHREALDKLDQPKEALSLLEKAMRQYRDVLTERPKHAAARDANFKAASMWRKIKLQMQQQEQQQQQDGDKNDQEQNDDKQQQDSQQNQDQKDNQQDRNQPSESKENENQKDKQDQASQDDKDQQQQEQNQAKQKDDQQKAKEQEAKQADDKEQVSREQAERQLREMVQAMRDRKKARRQQVEPVRTRPVDKDW